MFLYFQILTKLFIVDTSLLSAELLLYNPVTSKIEQLDANIWQTTQCEDVARSTVLSRLLDEVQST